MIQQLNIDLVLEFRVPKYFLKDEKRLTFEKVKNDLNLICDLNLYTLLEDEEYIRFALKEELLNEHFSLFLTRQAVYMLNSKRFDECLLLEDYPSMCEKLEKLSNDNYKYIRYNPCFYLRKKMLKEWFTYEVEYSFITFCDSNGEFWLEGSEEYFAYLKSLIKRRYPALGDAVYIHYTYYKEDEISNESNKEM